MNPADDLDEQPTRKETFGAGTPTHVELLKWLSPSGWIEPSGGERFVLNAAGVVEGQEVVAR